MVKNKKKKRRGRGVPVVTLGRRRRDLFRRGRRVCLRRVVRNNEMKCPKQCGKDGKDGKEWGAAFACVCVPQGVVL